MKKYLTLFAAALLITACSTEDEKDTAGGYTPSTDGIKFDAVLDQNTTRAYGEIADDNTLKNLTFENHPSNSAEKRGFGVLGLYTGRLKYENTSVSPDFMFNQHVTFSSGEWTYNPVKYWPNESGDYVSFFAYAPYEPMPMDDGRCIIDMSKNYDLGDPWVNYRLSKDPWNKDGNQKTEPQVDLMYGVSAANGKPLTDQYHINETGAENGYGIEKRVSIKFIHALACFGDKMGIRMTPALADKLDGYADVKVTKVTINYKNLTNKARLVLNCYGSANWKEIISGELTVTRTYEKEVDINFPKTSAATNTDEQVISEGDGLFFIPLRIAGTEAAYAEIIVDYEVNNGVTTYKGSSTTTYTLPMNTQGEKTQLTLELGENLQLKHLVLPLSSPATEPSYSRQWK